MQREPLGVVAAIAPWNNPQMLATFKYARALAAGCKLVMKRSSDALLDSCLLAEAVLEAEIPPGVVNIVTGRGGVGACLVQHPGVDKVAFNGPNEVGREIADVRAAALPSRPGTRREVSDDLARRRRPRLVEHRTGLLLRHAAQQRADLLPRHPDPRLRSRYDELGGSLAGWLVSPTVGNPLDPGTHIGPS